MGFVSVQSTWFDMAPVLTWSLFFSMVMLVIGLFSGSYAPHSSYYLGVWNGAIDDVFTIRDDVDRAHFMLGLLVSTVGALNDAYVAILGDRWLWQDRTPTEFRIAAHLLGELANQTEPKLADTFEAEHLQHKMGALKILLNLQLVRVEQGRIKLHAKGREFLHGAA